MLLELSYQATSSPLGLLASESLCRHAPVDIKTYKVLHLITSITSPNLLAQDCQQLQPKKMDVDMLSNAHDWSGKTEALSKSPDNNGGLGEALRPKSETANICQTAQSRTTANASSFSTAVDAVTPIAIVGMSCRFPGGATDTEKLWNLVAEGRAAWSKVPESRFNVDAFYHPNSDRTNTVSSTLFIDTA